ncbi:hypothetical protein BU17DRAFT_99680 [Hysterangium stoloniferum]|nr:hypothetical protein BU17DRAFT_99680 [Hysterangium stoloniferum]
MSIHQDEEYYENPTIFGGFRSSRTLEDGTSPKDQAVATRATFLAIEHGGQACPGRFFSVYELKN